MKRHRRASIPGNEELTLAERKKVYEARYRAKNPEKYAANKKRANASANAKAQKAAYRARTIEQERHASALRRVEAYRADPMKGREDARRWRESNPGKAKDVRRRHYERNKEAIAAAGAEKNARRKARYTAGDVTLDTWRAVIAMHDGCCVYCGERARMTMDHIVPLSRGGEHSLSNLVPACGSCNSSKGAKLLHEWLRERFVRLGETG